MLFTLILIYAVFIILGLVSYVLSSYAFMVMAKKAGIKNAWLAWIPIANLWIFGELISDYLGKHSGWKVIIATVLYFVLISFEITVLTGIALVLYLVFSVVITYWLFKKYSNKYILHTILSIIIPFYYPIVLTIIKHNEPNQKQ